ncbi:MAG: 3-keto-5-aminohexanoate cleavage protein [Planctomycetota bacterium]|nr:MAG: 3-keto-5-aminohexanoate cleavage protein [Planctomycetota bacterium]
MEFLKEGNMAPLPRKVVISCALTGVASTRKQCPHIPYTPKELAEEARRAYEAGASIIHFHGREDDGSPSWRVEVFQEIKERTQELCPVILNFSTGGIGLPIEERAKHIQEVRPEIGALNMGSMNYAIYSEKKKKLYFDQVFSNPFHDIIYLLKIMKEAGVKPECETFDSGHIGNARLLLDMGLLSPPLQFSLIMGVYGGIEASVKNLVHQASLLPEGSFWQVIGISLGQWHMVSAALAMGGHVRVGMEDNFYLEPGVMAKSNGELVEKAVRMAKEIGREVATVEEARSLLGLS